MKTKVLITVSVIMILSFARTANAQPHKHHRSRPYYPHYKYQKMPHWGYTYRAAPKRAYVVRHRGVGYYFDRGVFYRPVGTKYVIAPAPIGVRVRVLPPEHVRVIVNGRIFYYYYGTYYVKAPTNNEFVTVAPPVGARVDALPDGYNKVYIEDKTYYEFEGTYYKAVIDHYGEVWYEVVGEK